MFRTRDFLLLFVTAVFLLVAIGATVAKQHIGQVALAPSVQLVEVSDEQIFSAELAEAVLLSREDRLTEMRRKIAEGGELTSSVPESVTVDEVTEASQAEETPVEITVHEVMKCSGYSAYQKPWSAEGVQFEISEGARIVYRSTEQVTNSLASSSPTVVNRTVLLQLPVHPYNTAPTCLASDVVGVAHDGSLIRNGEAGLYGVFGESTMIGYALDGHPIYGTSDASTDSCGGITVGGVYRYVLSEERETVLNCFMASAISL